MSGTIDKLSTCDGQMKQNPQSFKLKHVFKNVPLMEDDDNWDGPTEDHFGIPWNIGISREEDYLAIYLYCERSENKKEWSIDTWFEIHILQPNGNSAHEILDFYFCFTKEDWAYGEERFLTWEKMEEEFLLNDELVVEIRVKINKMTGIEVYLRRFDDEECSDVALVVNSNKFHVSKLYLASQSSYFKSMFLGNFNESGKAEIELSGIDEYDFQKYLELLYGEDALNDETVGGILQLADMHDTKTLIERCEEYLLENSHLTMSGTVDKYPACKNNEMDLKTRSFSLKHVFKNVSKMEENQQYRSDTEEHYGVPW
ncbi:unnamed protein product [Caenorhabditis brenneri]